MSTVNHLGLQNSNRFVWQLREDTADVILKRRTRGARNPTARAYFARVLLLSHKHTQRERESERESERRRKNQSLLRA
jgi:hypothetical protein